MSKRIDRGRGEGTLRSLEGEDGFVANQRSWSAGQNSGWKKVSFQVDLVGCKVYFTPHSRTPQAPYAPLNLNARTRVHPPTRLPPWYNPANLRPHVSTSCPRSSESYMNWLATGHSVVPERECERTRTGLALEIRLPRMIMSIN